MQCRGPRRTVNTTHMQARAINLSAGCAALPLEVLLRAQKEMVEFRGRDGQPRSVVAMRVVVSLPVN